MKEHPIIFSADMVKAILEDRKTQTRRVIKPQPPEDAAKVFYWWHGSMPKEQCASSGCYYWYPRGLASIDCPYGEPGDRLWVKETFQIVMPWGSVDDEWIGDDIMEVDGPLGSVKPEQIGYWWNIVYKAQDDICSWWRPSIFMPRWASRITLEIVNIRVQRIQEINGDECMLEGIQVKWSDPNNNMQEKMAFKALWDSINSKRGYGWDVNPWAWVIEFKRVESTVCSLGFDMEV